MTNISGQPPGGIFTPRHVRVLKLAVAIMSVLLVSGVVALVFGVARQVSKLGKPATPAAVSETQSPYKLSLDLGQGKLESAAASGDFLILHWRGESADTILTIDPRSGRELGRIQVPRR
jgi:hypothetical protein